MIRHILLATNGSRNSAKAEDYALYLAALCNCSLTVLYVVDNRMCHYGEVDQLATKPVMEEYLSYLERMNEQGRLDIAKGFAAKASKTGILYSVRIRNGVPEKEIVAAAQENSVDLVVIGGGKTHIGLRLLPPSETVAKVLKKSSCPVLVASDDVRPELKPINKRS